MGILSFFKFRTPNSSQSILDFAPGLKLSPYVGEYLAAIDRTEEFGFEARRVLVRKDCIDMLALRPVLLDYFERSPPDSMIGPNRRHPFCFGAASLRRNRHSFQSHHWLAGIQRQIHLSARRAPHSALHRRKHRRLARRRLPIPPLADLARVRDSRRDLRRELRLGQNQRRARRPHRLPTRARATT
jgi:hypothetical protein